MNSNCNTVFGRVWSRSPWREYGGLNAGWSFRRWSADGDSWFHFHRDSLWESKLWYCLAPTLASKIDHILLSVGVRYGEYGTFPRRDKFRGNGLASRLRAHPMRGTESWWNVQCALTICSSVRWHTFWIICLPPSKNSNVFPFAQVSPQTMTACERWRYTHVGEGGRVSCRPDPVVLVNTLWSMNKVRSLSRAAAHSFSWRHRRSRSCILVHQVLYFFDL